MWVALGLMSALFLGIYDVCKKWSLRDNAVLAVLFLSNCAALLCTLPVLVCSLVIPETMSKVGLLASFPSALEHVFIFAKTLLVSVSWICAFFALKHLPISIVSPIRASAPLWTLLGAVSIFGEQLGVLHFVAIGIIFISYYIFSVVGKKEGIAFLRNRWILLVAIATLTGALSSLYDKYLLHRMGICPITLQVWFSLYLVGVNGIVFWISRRLDAKALVFQWRVSIALVGIFLVVADYLYFRALSNPDALVAVLSIVRRSSVIISFLVGGILFKERNKRKKLLPLAGVLVGVALLCLHV